MKYAGYMPNDFVNGEGVCTSFWTQGCPFHCVGCHNPESWDFDGGFEVPTDIKGRLIKAISANGIQRNFSVLGGEPLCEQNRELVEEVLAAVKQAYPHIRTFLWTGYTLDQLQDIRKNDERLDHILNLTDELIAGPFILSERDITLKFRGSKNQQIYLRKVDY